MAIIDLGLAGDCRSPFIATSENPFKTQSSVLKLLTINGRLTFDQPEAGDVDLHLKSYHIFVNIGGKNERKLFIGSADLGSALRQNKPFAANDLLA